MSTAQDRIAVALERIADALEGWTAVGAPEPEPCAHPADQRLDMSTMGHIRWTCNACGLKVGDWEGLE